MSATGVNRGRFSCLGKAAGARKVPEAGPLTRPHVLLPHGSVLLLAGRVENVKESDLLVNEALLAVGVLCDVVSCAPSEVPPHSPMVGSYLRVASAKSPVLASEFLAEARRGMKVSRLTRRRTAVSLTSEREYKLVPYPEARPSR